MNGIWPALSLLLVVVCVGYTNAGLWDVIKRSRRNYPDNELAMMYWNSPVSFGVYVNNDFGGDGTGDTIKRTDTPLHPAGSGSGSGGNYFADSAKRDSVPTPKKVEMEKKSELTAQAAKVEVQGEDDETKRHTTVTCQGQKEWLQCPMYHLIKINSAFWGRDEEAACSKSSVEHGLKTDKMCAQDESNTMIKVQNACDGESACELVSSPVYFDRTDCPDVYKFLRVNWECAHSESRLKDTIDGGTKDAAENTQVEKPSNTTSTLK